MKKQTILSRIFPTATDFGRSGDEVNGLKAGTRPMHCIVLKSVDCPSPSISGKRRDFYLVLIQFEGRKYLLEFRICTADENSGYAEFAVVHLCEDVTEVSVDQYNELIDTSFTSRRQKMKDSK
jgi:hypothetical protein